MNNELGLESLRDIGLLPHQAEFIIEFLKPESPPYHWLIAPPGTGKSVTVATLASRILAKKPTARILILTGKLVAREQFAQALQEIAHFSDVIRVDQQIFRELELRVDVGETPWAGPVIALMTLQKAIHPNIVKSLTTTEWDLVVVDRPYTLSDKQEAVVKELIHIGIVKRLLLIAAFLERSGTTPLIPNLMTTTWSRDVVDWEGNPLFASRVRMVVDYDRSPFEIEFLDKMDQVLRQLEPPDTEMALLKTTLLLRMASSSLYAIEQSLRRRRNRLVHSTHLQMIEADAEEIGEIEDEFFDEPLENKSQRTRTELTEELSKLSTLLDHLDNISADTKLQALLDILKQRTISVDVYRICIFSEFASTVSYLYSSLQEELEDIYQFTTTPHDERDHTIRSFRETGGILVASSAAITGLDWMNLEIDIGINYDLPSHDLQMEQRWAMLDRPGRKNPCMMYAFRDTSKSLPFEEESLKRHGFLAK